MEGHEEKRPAQHVRYVGLQTSLAEASDDHPSSGFGVLQLGSRVFGVGV